MHKIPSYLENPIDNLIFIIVEFLAPYCYMFNIKPNLITTLSIFCGLLSAYLIYIHKFLLSSISYIIAYILDCLDGYVARKYNLVTKFGDMYDHVGDIVKIIAIIIAFCLVNVKLFLIFLPILLYVFFMSCVHLGYQETFYGQPESDFLNILKFLCPANCCENDLKNNMKYTKFFGIGTLTFSIIILMLIYGEYYTEFKIKTE